MEATDQSAWRKCSTCKKPIPYGAKYYVCSVSTCNGQRTGYVFCSVSCFESHVPGARHRDAGAIAHTAPSRIIARTPSSSSMASAAPSAAAVSQEVLIIASRLKDYIQARGDMNTSASVMDVLSQHVRVVCDRAMENARADGRKTVMDRDFDFLKGR